jgi:hypothetical protein
MLLALITAAVFGLGYWSAYARIAQLGGTALPRGTKVFMGVMGLIFAFIAFSLINSTGLGVIIAEFFVLCSAQTLGYILSGKSKKS